MGIGSRHQIWTKELENKLISEIIAGRKMIGLTVSLKMSNESISKKLKLMGFENFSDAKRVLCN